MKKASLFPGLTLLLFGLLFGTSTAIGQIFNTCDPCDPVECQPCDPLSNSCDPCGSGRSGFFTPFLFSGWVEMGVRTNGNSNGSDNGPASTGSRRRTDFMMSQLYLSAEKEMNTRRGFDWGACADFVYGAHAGSMQTYDGSFDAGWGDNRHGYSMSAYKLYGTIGYKDWSFKVGKFVTHIGWEGSASKNNIFYSHSYCYWIEPATHMGALATYDVTDRLSVSAGWTAGMDSSFANPYGNSAIMTGLEYMLSDDATVYYWINAGKQNDIFEDARDDYFIQSVCLEWALTKRFTYVHQYNLRNDNQLGGGRCSSYGLNNHFLYALSDELTFGTRVEWLRDNCGGNDLYVGTPGDYWNVTWGLRWDPYTNLSVRPEVRYDWYNGAGTPFGGNVNAGIDGTRKDQVSAGLGVLVSF